MDRNAWRQVAAALRLLASAVEAIEAPTSEPEHYTSANYPFGRKAFYRHKAHGMRVLKPGKEYVVRRDDAEAYWQTLRRSPAQRPRPANDDDDAEIRANLAAAGIELRRVS